MRPIELSFKGINSYTKVQTVDFKSLTMYKIFGIVGRTGAGKTTVIDAIILSLYGRVPRFDSSRDFSFVNRDADECFVSFTFSVFSDNVEKTYKVHRAYKIDKDGKVKPIKATLLEVNSSEEVALIDDTIIDKSTNKQKSRTIASLTKELDENILSIIGLSYDDFTKAVILPQGKFNDFLVLKNAERGEVLERIFSLEKYGNELVSKFNNEKKKNDENIRICESNILAIGDFSNEEKISKENEIVSIEKENIEIKNKISDNENKINANKEILTYLNDYIDNKYKKDELLKNSETIENTKKRILNAENAININEDIQNEKKQMLEKIELETTFRNITDKMTNIEKELSHFQNEKVIFDNKKNVEYENLLNKISDIKTLIEDNKSLDDDKKNIDSLRKNLVEIQKNTKEYILESENIKNNIDKDEKELVILNQNLQNNIVKSEVSIAVSDGKNLINLINETEKKENELTLKKEKYVKELNVLKIEINDINLEKDKLLDIEKNQKSDEILYYKSILLKNVKKMDDCPICGHTINVDLDVHETSKNFDDEIYNKLQSVSLKLQSKTDAFKNMNKSILEIDTELEKVSIEKKILQDKINLIKVKYEISDFDEKIKEIESKEKLSEEIRIKISNTNEQVQKYRLIFDDLATKINIKNAEISDITIQGKHLKEKIKTIEDKINEKTDGIDKDIYLKNLLSKRDDFINTEKELTDKINVLLTEKNNITIDFEKTKIILETVNKSLVELDKNIDLSINRYGFIDRVDVIKNILDKSEIDVLSENIKSYENDMHFYSENVLKITKILSSKNIDVLNIDVIEFSNDIKADILNLEALQNTFLLNNSKVAKLNEELNQLNLKEEKIKVFSEKIKTYEYKKDLLNQIIKLIQGNRFVKYIAKRYLHHICIDASSRLYKMSEGKYTLEQDETDFKIKDHFRGNITRSVESISGGEQFMVSLCLALSLSSYISRKNNGSMDMFFLDEGFGSLDDQTLDNVVNILFNVGDSDMCIGVITHVTKLQESLPRKLVITKDDNEMSSEIMQF